MRSCTVPSGFNARYHATGLQWSRRAQARQRACMAAGRTRVSIHSLDSAPGDDQAGLFTSCLHKRRAPPWERGGQQAVVLLALLWLIGMQRQQGEEQALGEEPEVLEGLRGQPANECLKRVQHAGGIGAVV